MMYHIIPFGCQMNRSDAERVKAVLESVGLKEAYEEDHPEIIIKGIISCSVRQRAIDRVYGKIRKWNESKKHRPVITFISGCVLPADEVKFLKLFDIVLAIEDVPRLPDIIRQYGTPGPVSVSGLARGELLQCDSILDITDARQLKRKISEKPRVVSGGLSDINILNSDFWYSSEPSVELEDKDASGAVQGTTGWHTASQGVQSGIEDFWKLQPNYTSRTEAYIPIQNGCDKFCTFCAVPYTRGREISRPHEYILDELRNLVIAGCKSVTLLGQNVNSYGQDKPGKEMDFPTLIEEAGKIGEETRKEFWLYFTSPHPRDFNEELLRVMAKYEVLANWIHLPVQSGDDKVLMHMNRNHSMVAYRQKVQQVREILPEATLFTDIIVGFSGETEQQFENTAGAMREFCYDMAYIAQYSPRPGARSARWDDDVSAAEKSRRFHYLSAILEEVALERRQKDIARIQRVLITGEDGLYFKGYNEGRIPIRLNGKGRVGEFVNAEITHVRPLSMQAAIVDTAAESREKSRLEKDGAPLGVSIL